MKRYSVILSALALLALSCTKEGSLLDDGKDRLITFAAATYEPQTRAAYSGSTFNVSAWTTGGARYMDAVEVAYNGSSWVTTASYYWPKSDSLCFVATSGLKSDAPWATVNDACTTLQATDVTVHPDSLTKADKLLLYTDRTSKYTYQSGDVPVLFKNALASVTASINSRMSDDVIQKDTAGLYREYEVYSPADSAGKTTYYVVPFGFSPNGALPPFKPYARPEPYPIKVKLKTPITHIWRIVAWEIKTVNVGNIGSLSMSMASNGVWNKPTNDVWDVPATRVAHADTVPFYDAARSKDLQGTPVPANLNDFQCPVTKDGYMVLPQDLNWSPLSAINNPKGYVNTTVEVYNSDTNGDGVFDYRDVYKYWVCKRDAKGAVTDSVCINTADSSKLFKASDGWEFYKWFEWDGTGSSVLHAVHVQYEAVKIYYKQFGIDVPDVTFCQILSGLAPHLKYTLEVKVDLAKLTNTDASKYWKMNTKTTYNISVTPVTNEITFNPDVAVWTDLGNVQAN